MIRCPNCGGQRIRREELRVSPDGFEWKNQAIVHCAGKCCPVIIMTEGEEPRLVPKLITRPGRYPRLPRPSPRSREVRELQAALEEFDGQSA